tara:strand:+ start:354 stop:587 length:234 start_codon:yes stop_codon:yes gene_type:complete
LIFSKAVLTKNSEKRDKKLKKYQSRDFTDVSASNKNSSNLNLISFLARAENVNSVIPSRYCTIAQTLIKDKKKMRYF